MIYKILFKFVISITLLLNLAACNMEGIKEDTGKSPDVDMLELRKQADAAYSKDDLVTSEKDYQILVKEMPEIALHWFRLGNIYVRTNRPYAAMDLYREAVVRDPKFAKAWYNLSIVQLKQTAFSLNEMLTYTERTDPLYSKARAMLEEIKAIITGHE